MLPDFPVQKKFFSSVLSDTIQRRLQKDRLISMIHIHRMHEGSSVHIQSPDFEDNIQLEQVGFEAEVAVDDVIREGPSIYMKQALAAAEAFIEAHHKMLFAKVDQVTEKAGNVTDARGKPFSPELLLDALERIELSFDETGNAKMPTMIMHPSLLESIKGKVPEWEQDPAYRRRLAEIIERQRTAWIDRENRRLLAD